MPSRAELMARLRAAGCVFAEDEAELLIAESSTAEQLADRVARRIAGEPLEPLLGWAEFDGLRITLEPGVFVPRRRTQLLVEEAVARARPGAVLVDLCCGSGAVGAAIAARVPTVQVFAADIDPAAVHCARRNLPSGRVFLGDLYEALPVALRGRVDILAVNAPYVPTGAFAFLPPEARKYEPSVALDGGLDGLDVHRRVVAGAPDWLAPTGQVLLETGADQVDTATALLDAVGLCRRVVQRPDLGATVVVGERHQLGESRHGRVAG